MLHVSIFIEGVRSQPRLMFWLAALAQAAIWWLVPTVFYAAPPGDLPMVLAVGHEYQLGTDLGPPLAFWLAEVVYVLTGLAGVYLLSQACVVVTYWAVFELGRALVGAQQAAIAVLLMLGITVMTVPSPDFGPAVLGMALTALMMLHFWRAIGEGQRRYWFVLAFDLGLLLLTTYAGVILFACLMLFMWATERGRAALQTVEPWFAAIVVAVLLFPHLIWLDIAGDTTFGPLWERLRSSEAADTNLIAWLRLLATVVAVHVGLLLLVALASGWRRKEGDLQLPTFVRAPLDPFARRFVYFMAIAPIVAATLLAAIVGSPAPVGGTAPYVTLSGLAAVVAAGDTIVIHRQRIVGLAWTLMLLLPPAIAVAMVIFVPWTVAIEMKSAQQADQMGAFFGKTFRDRTGKPLTIITGDQRLATLIALAAPSRPSYYDAAAPMRTPWVTPDDIRKRGLIVVWPASGSGGAPASPPADIKARFPDLVPEVPRAFGYTNQGMLPLARVGWGMIRPQ
ncbi:MAG TPA: glycosyltransferase family 39 protein [Xanthobacteraceae bacterium]|nr:glycosyltransferase family 39 protein [Xanthobacteraceae bacterium]